MAHNRDIGAASGGALQVMEWGTGNIAGASLFWNPGAISYLAELLLAALLALYLAVRACREAREGRAQPQTLLLVVLMLAVVPTFLTSMFRVLTAGGWVSYAMPWSRLDGWTTLAMPWSRPFGGISSMALTLLAYLFPRPLRGANREMQLVATMLCVLILVEAGIALRSDIAILMREIWWRPQWMAGWMNIAMIWAAIVFWRQFADASRAAECSAGGSNNRGGIAALWRSAPNREASVARAFLVLTLLPIIHTTALFLPDESQFGRYPLDIFICWLALAQLVGLTLVLIGYVPERSSFLFKLTLIGLAVLLAMVNGVAWMVAPAYEAQFRSEAMPGSGQALRFVPRGGVLGYAVQPAAFLPERARGDLVGEHGARIDLPFSLPFYGRTYRQVHVDQLGSIGFDRMPHPSDAAFENGVQPAIWPLLVEQPPSGTRITAYTDAERLILTRRDRCTPDFADRCYQVQTIVSSDGRIDIHYLDVPPTPRFALFDPLRAPWLVGITPGTRTDAGPPVLQDHYRAFMVHLDRLFAPLAVFIVAMAVAATLMLPLVFQSFVVEPLDRLLRGIRRFRNGEQDIQVPAAYNDEIGYLIDSFNTMAREQTALTRGLEDRVADRVAEIADLTVHSAKLEERARLSADLHDAVAQSLASATLHANALPARLQESGEAPVEAAEKVARLSRHALNEMRSLLVELRFGSAQISLADRLSELVDSFAQLHALTVDCDLADTAPLPPEVGAMFFRVAQECLNNVVKHSGASQVELVFEALACRAMLMVSDKGCGFDPAEVDRRERLGLAIMRDRARMIGATLEIDSQPGQGCRVTMIWIG